MEILFFIAVAIFILLFVAIKLFIALGRRINYLNAVLASALFIGALFFWGGISSYDQDYFRRVDMVDTNYTPFATGHYLTLFIFLALSLAALILVWIKQRALPPLLLVIVVGMTLIGVIINAAIIIQVTRAESGGSGFYLLPLAYIITTAVILTRLLRAEVSLAADRTYKEPMLNYLNTLLANTKWQPLWMLLLAFPLFLLVVFILVLFGQDPHAITKVFTDTTTWGFSTKTHRPLLDYAGGHYLCTVAACGDAGIVKPIGWGQRHGYPILVNRQLQIANAFEEVIQDNWPALHRVIRKFYDEYGYPLSTKITTAKSSNITYKLMKPLEYFFLAVLYLTCVKPEEKIGKQYSNG